MLRHESRLNPLCFICACATHNRAQASTHGTQGTEKFGNLHDYFSTVCVFPLYIFC